MHSINLTQLRDTPRLKALLRAGRTVELRERDRVIARIIPVPAVQATAMPVGSPDELNEAMSQAVERVRQLRRDIQEATTGREEVWFGNLMLGILNCALLDHYSVEVGVQKSIYLAAWGRRNLLELKVITAYVLASESNAIDFRNDLVIDAKEFYEAMTKHHQASHKKLLAALSEMADQEKGPIKGALEQALRRESVQGPQTGATDSEAATYKQLMVNFGLKENDKPKKASQIARLISQEEDFNPMFKICSKIMHRTTLSIASSISHGSLDEAIPLLSHSSACDLLLIYEAINAHFKERGIRPPKS